MANPVPESVDFTNIRQTIRQIILPLVQAIYDENPSDIIQFCSGYFNNFLQQRENDQHTLNEFCTGETCHKEIKQSKIFESKKTEMVPTNLQESASDPVLTANKWKENVNLRGKTSSWDTPCNFIEPIKSIAVLEDAACGIGDQPTTAKHCSGLENATKGGDAYTHVKDVSAYEDDSLNQYVILDEINDSTAEEDLKSTYSCDEGTNKGVKALCTQFERMKTVISDTLKLDDSKHDSSDQEMTSKKDIKMSRNQLSPNSSFGFVPNLKQYHPTKEEKKIDFGDSKIENLKAEAEEINIIANEVSQTFYNLAEEINNTETNFNEKIKNAKEISDIIPRQNVNAKNFANSIPDEVSNCEDNSCSEVQNVCSSSDKLANAIDEDEADTKKISDVPVAEKTKHENFRERLKPEEKEYEEIKTKYHEEKARNIVDRIDDGNDNDRSGQSQTETVVDKLWRKKWYEAHPTLGNLNNSWRRDHRLLSANFSNCRSNAGEAGDVPFNRFYSINEASNDKTNIHSKNQTNSETSTNSREFNYSRFCSDDSARPSAKVCERKASSVKMSNANPQSIPYAWRNLCKQTHSSESVISKEPQTKLKEEACDSTKSEKEDNISSLSEANKTFEANAIKNKEVFFETSSELHEERELVIQKSKELKIEQLEDKIKSDISSRPISNQNTNTSGLHKILDETGLITDSKDKNHAKAYLPLQNASTHNQNTSELGKEAQTWKKCSIEGNKEMNEKHFENCRVSVDSEENTTINQITNHQIKDELCPNAACGDFEYSINEFQGTDGFNENNQKYENREGISLEYVGEIIERVCEQQRNDSKDSYEDMNFSNDTESCSSYAESSDFSDDCTMNDSMQDDLSLNNSMQDK